MNYNIPPEQEYMLLLEYYKSGSSEGMPEELHRMSEIYKFAAPQVERGYLDGRAIGRMIHAEFGQKYNISANTCYKHAVNAIRYYRETFAFDTKTLRTILTRKLLKLLDFHYEHTLPEKPAAGQKAINEITARIIELNPTLRLPDAQELQDTRDSVFVLSDRAEDFPDLNQISRARFLELVEDFTTSFELSDEQRAELIRRDINGAIM